MTSNKMFWYSIIGLLVAVFIVVIYVANQQIGPSPVPGEVTQPQSSMLRIGKNAIYVAEQPPGKRVNASVVAIEVAGYVVIHEADENDKPGASIGASALLASGEQADVGITTTKPLLNGKSYIAMLHADNGNGVYDNESTDAAILENGAPVWMIFQAVTGASGSSLISL